jgi:DNA helicase-2/ATP-dependent DNA helicase PcrA
MRYANAFPRIAKPCEGMPKTGPEWDQLYRGTTLALTVAAVRDVVASSYDRVLIDEYQDCHAGQHALAVALSAIVPTVVFGDPMQGIFEFAGANLSWDGGIHNNFPLAGTLETPHRWEGKNPDLGAWIAQTRLKLMYGEPIDLSAGPIAYRRSDDAFDMGTFFDGLDDREGTHAAIHCNKTMCYRLAAATRGAFQAIEEMASGRLQQFAAAWDASAHQDSRFSAVDRFIDDCFHIKKLAENEAPDPEDQAMDEEMTSIAGGLAGDAGVSAARSLFAMARRRPHWRLYRREIWRDAERAITELASGRALTMTEASARVRQRTASSGRQLSGRIVSTPLLLKGLEFDHVIVPNAAHFQNEQNANAKLFYVAISRATRSLTISSPQPVIRFPAARI